MSVEFLYGRRPVYESLRAGRRSFQRLLTVNDDLGGVLDLARMQQIPIDIMSSEDLDARTGASNHQGVVLQTAEYPYVPVENILAASRSREEAPFLLLLDLLQDVQNVGTMLRTAEAVGIHGVVIQERRAAAITPAVVSASSGAVEHLNIARVTNLVRTMKHLKDNDVWIAGLERGEDTTRYDQANLTGGLALVVGSEGQGLRRLVRETCDFLIHLPMKGQIESLNASTAGSIALYAAWQAREFS